MKRKQGWILYPKSTLNNKTNAFEWLSQEAAKFNINIRILFFENFTIESGLKNVVSYNGEDIELPDFIVMRGYEFILSHHFESMGVPVINTFHSMMLSLNKMLTHQILSKNNIITPKTIYNSDHLYDYIKLSEELDNERFIVKSMDGSKGENIFLVENQAELDAALQSCKNNCIAQKFVETSFGRDIRTWVIGNKVVAAVVRYSETSFKSNYSQGGKVKTVEITPEIEHISVSSAQSLGLEFAGVDLLFDEKGYTVCEINGNAGFRSISSISDENIPYKLFEYIREKY